MFWLNCGHCRMLSLLQAGHGGGLHAAFPAPLSFEGQRLRHHPDENAQREREGVFARGRLCHLKIESGKQIRRRPGQASVSERDPGPSNPRTKLLRRGVDRMCFAERFRGGSRLSLEQQLWLGDAPRWRLGPIIATLVPARLRRASGANISPGPYRSFRELSLAGFVDPDIWCPPTFVGNSGIERFNGVCGFAL